MQAAKPALLIVVLFLCSIASAPSLATKLAYVNLAPDHRFSINGEDSRISFDTDRGLFGYGNDFGKLESCTTPEQECLVFGFMALLKPRGVFSLGDRYQAGEFTFGVTKKFALRAFGVDHEVYRVDVEKAGKKANSYLFEEKKGIIAIITQNFDSKEIPESIFFLRDESGLFCGCEPTTVHSGTPSR